MSTTTTNSKKTTSVNTEIGSFIGEIISYNTSLKLFHWHVTDKGSYAKHIALDQAIDTLLDVTDRIVETTYALNGDLKIVVPETKVPSDIIKDSEKFFKYVGDQRTLFPEAFTQAIIDDYQEAIQQLLYRLKRLE